MNISPCFGQGRMGPPRASFESHGEQQYPTAFASNAGQVDRSEGRGFAGFANSQPSPDQIVLDGRSGKYLVEPSRPNLESLPMSRFCENPSPWNAQGIEGMGQWEQGPRFMTHGRQSIVRPHAQWGSFRETARSNPESHLTSRQQPDSGYGTALPRTKSVVSGGEYLDHQEDDQSFVNGVNGMQLQRGSPTTTTFYPSGSQAARSVNVEDWNEPEEESGSLKCQDPKCGEGVKFKNLSELK